MSQNYIPIKDSSVWDGVSPTFKGRRFMLGSNNYTKAAGLGFPSTLYSIIKPIFRAVGNKAKEHIKKEIIKKASHHGTKKKKKTKKTNKTKNKHIPTISNRPGLSIRSTSQSAAKKGNQSKQKTKVQKKNKKALNNGGGPNDLF